MRRQQQDPYGRSYSFSMNQSIDYPSKCKFGFHSVLANTLEHLLGMIKVSALPPVFRIVCLPTSKAGDSQTVLDTYGAPEHDRSIVHCSYSSIARSVIVPLIGLLATDLVGLILFTLSRYHEDAMSIVAVVGASESRSRQTLQAT
jgi:hypothetical protein